MAYTLSRQWKTVPVDEAASALLRRELNLSRPVAGLLASRGYVTPEAAERFLRPRLSELGDPFVLPGMAAAVERVWRAIRSGERLVVYGDYDVDGITSAALLIKVLRLLGAQAYPFLPHRLDEGYGLSMDALQRCLEEHQPSLLVTVDCGTGSVAAVRIAAERGVDVIVTDHHTPPDEVAPALAVINPKLGPVDALKLLAGVGVAFKLAHALVKQGRQQNHDVAKGLDLRDMLDLVALGTITDIVPLRDENRILACHGLAQLNRTQNLGLQTLHRVAGIEGRIDAYEVGFRIGPRLNAAGRLGDALRALDLLLTSSSEAAQAAAVGLDQANRERQAIEAEMVRTALADLEETFDPGQHFGLVVAHEGWHPGVIGIVASRICQRFGRPVVCIAVDGAAGRGSCRGVEGFDMVQGLGRCAGVLSKFGGHAMAAGLELETGNIPRFRAQFNEVVRNCAAEVDLRPVQRIDGWIELGEVDLPLWRAMEPLRPFGFGNATPLWACRGLRVVGRPRTVGQGHLKMILASGGVQREAIGFGLAERSVPEGMIDVVFQLRSDTFTGTERMVMNIQDFRPSESNG